MDKQELYNKVEDLDIFSIGIRKYVALSEVMYLIKQLDEPQKVVIPHYVADWIEYCKEHNFTLLGCLDPVDELGMSWSEGFKGDARKCVKWCIKESNTFAKAWGNGYEIEKEKKYTVMVNNTMEASKYLKYDKVVKKWYFGMTSGSDAVRLYHTKEELISGGFEWVLSCEGVEVEEVEE
jgi:hypothetical protein|nr:MAG TPA: Protein of unknown function (DUF1642) [Caudoviricetes sp.]